MIDVHQDDNRPSHNNICSIVFFVLFCFSIRSHHAERDIQCSAGLWCQSCAAVETIKPGLRVDHCQHLSEQVGGSWSDGIPENYTDNGDPVHQEVNQNGVTDRLLVLAMSFSQGQRDR